MEECLMTGYPFPHYKREINVGRGDNLLLSTQHVRSCPIDPDPVGFHIRLPSQHIKLFFSCRRRSSTATKMCQQTVTKYRCGCQTLSTFKCPRGKSVGVAQCGDLYPQSTVKEGGVCLSHSGGKFFQEKSNGILERARI